MADEPVRIPIEGELDLHAFQPRDIPSVVEEYLNEAHAAGLREVRLVHGRGIGVQRAVVHRTLIPSHLETDLRSARVLREMPSADRH